MSRDSICGEHGVSFACAYVPRRAASEVPTHATQNRALPVAPSVVHYFACLHIAKHTPYDHSRGRYTMVTGLNISLPTNPRQHIKV